MPIYVLLDKYIIVYQKLLSLFQTTKINNIQALRSMQKCAQEDISEELKTNVLPSICSWSSSRKYLNLHRKVGRRYPR